MSNWPKTYLLIFDLDETLVHATKTKLERDPELRVGDFYIYKRPNLDDFIQACSAAFKIAIWSAAEDEYVRTIVKEVIPANVKLEFVWTRNNCSVKIVKKPLLDELGYAGSFKEHQWIKPVRRIKQKGIGIKTMLIIDDSPYKVTESKENALIIKSYEGDSNDDELNKLLDFLSSLNGTKDLRKIDKKEWAFK